MKKLILAVALAASSFGAAAQSNEAHILISRDSTLNAAFADLRVEVNGLEVCAIPNGEQCHFKTEAGVKQVSLYVKTLWGTKSDPTDVTWNIEEGKSYEFATAPRNIGFTMAFGIIGSLIDAARDANENVEQVQTGLFRIKAISVN